MEGKNLMLTTLSNSGRNPDMVDRKSGLIRESKKRELSSDELLELSSRSFYNPIKLLSQKRGQNEYDKKSVIENLYLDLRELDTIEDCKLPIRDKPREIDNLLFVFDHIRRRNQNESIDDLIEGKLKDLTRKIRKEAVDEAEEVFIDQFGKGSVLKRLHSFDYAPKNFTTECLKTMGLGMKNYLREKELETVKELHDYCYYVAGSVGEALNKLVYRHDKVKLSSELARSFGGYLQLINILRNPPSDKKVKNRIKFIPSEFSKGNGITYHQLFNSTDSKAKESRKHALETLVEEAEKNFVKAADYVISIPSEKIPGYEAFCLIPLVTGEKMLEVIKNTNPDELFRRQDSIKPEGGRSTVINIMHFAESLAPNRAESFEIEYQRNPKRFSFRSEDYLGWSPEWFND
jgi:phytoene/squalene synthetase